MIPAVVLHVGEAIAAYGKCHSSSCLDPDPTHHLKLFSDSEEPCGPKEGRLYSWLQLKTRANDEICSWMQVYETFIPAKQETTGIMFRHNIKLILFPIKFESNEC